MANFNELPKVTFQDIVAEAKFGNLGYADTYLSPNFLTAPIIAWASVHAKSEDANAKLLASKILAMENSQRSPEN